jgi:hypothetical protein
LKELTAWNELVQIVKVAPRTDLIVSVGCNC